MRMRIQKSNSSAGLILIFQPMNKRLRSSLNSMEWYIQSDLVKLFKRSRGRILQWEKESNSFIDDGSHRNVEEDSHLSSLCINSPMMLPSQQLTRVNLIVDLLWLDVE